jgi:hypothetical protein
MTAANQESGIHTIEQLAETIVKAREMRAELNRTGPFDVAIGARARLDYKSRASADAYIEEVGQLGDVGVNWIMVAPPHRSRQAFVDNVAWFGEEVIARL